MNALARRKRALELDDVKKTEDNEDDIEDEVNNILTRTVAHDQLEILKVYSSLYYAISFLK